MADQYGAAQPIIDLMQKYHDNVSKALDMIPSFGVKPMADKDAGSSTDSGKLPDAWAEANRKSVEQTKAMEAKPLSQRTLGGRKRPPIKKPSTNQAQRKQP